MVAEATPEIQTQTGNADSPPANAVSAEVEEYFSQGQGEPQGGTPETVAAETPPEPSDLDVVAEAAKAAAESAADKATREAHARIERENAEKAKTAEQIAAQQKHRQSYLDGINVIPKTVGDYVRNQINMGADPATVAAQVETYLANWANQHNGLGVQQYESIAKEAAQAEYVTAFNNTIDGLLNADQRREWRSKAYESIEDAAKAAVAAATKGMVTEAEAKAQAKLEVVKYQHYLEEKGLLVGTRSVRQNTGTTVVGGTRITNDIENARAFNEGRITREQYAANEEAFKKQGA